MGDKRPYKPRKPGAGRKPLKPDYNAAAILQEQIQTAVVLYEEDNSLQTIRGFSMVSRKKDDNQDTHKMIDHSIRIRFA